MECAFSIFTGSQVTSALIFMHLLHANNLSHAVTYVLDFLVAPVLSMKVDLCQMLIL